MAFASTTEWDVRTTGSDSNGGGFDLASSGTDYSIQDSPQVTYTDLVIDGTTNTKITSAGNPFTSAHVGNVINITSGTGFTVQRVQVVSVTSGAATCDKAVGTLGSTGGNGKLGGGLLTIGAANTLSVNGNTLHIKSGTYTITAKITISARVMWKGYNSTHGDQGTRPLITTATNSVLLLELTTASNSPQIVTIQNINMSHTAATRGMGLQGVNSSLNFLFLLGCQMDGFSIAVDNSNNGMACLQMVGVEIKNSTGSYSIAWKGSGMLTGHGCWIHSGAGTGIDFQTNDTNCVFSNSVISGNVDGFSTANSAVYHLTLMSCAIQGNTGAGVKLRTQTSTLQASNCIFYGNGTYGVDFSAGVINGNPTIAGFTNAWGNNTTNDVHNLSKGPTDITLTADPFTTAGSDFSLNTAGGGGALLRALGWPGSFNGGTGYADVGPLQHQDTGGGGGGSVALNPLAGVIS